jgi:hypothetical protein
MQASQGTVFRLVYYAGTGDDSSEDLTTKGLKIQTVGRRTIGFEVRCLMMSMAVVAVDGDEEPDR